MLTLSPSMDPLSSKSLTLREKAIHFGGIEGKRFVLCTWRRHTTPRARTVSSPCPSLWRYQRYAFGHPNGLFFATRLGQIVLVATEKAAFEDMQLKSFIQNNTVPAGRPLGEYSAPASVADVLPISLLADVVFCRGVTMQRAIERDPMSRSNYAMCAVEPL